MNGQPQPGAEGGTVPAHPTPPTLEAPPIPPEVEQATLAAYQQLGPGPVAMRPSNMVTGKRGEVPIDAHPSRRGSSGRRSEALSLCITGNN